MKAIFAFVALAACLLLLAGSCSVEFRVFGSPASGVPDKAPKDSSPEVRDAFALRSSGASTNADETAVQIADLLTDATNQGPQPGAQLLRSQLPALFSDFAGELPLLLDRVSRTETKTASGFTCREALVRLIPREHRLYRRLAAGVQTRHPWRAVDRFASGWASLSRWYAARLNRCVELAPAADREKIQVVLRSF